MTVDNSTEFISDDSISTQATEFLDSGWLLTAALEFYSQYALIGIAIIGTAANALVLYALIVHNARETKKRVVNWLVINQNLLDLCCCVISLISLAIRVSNVYLTGALGYALCSIFNSANAVYCLLNASEINLMTITMERYLKVVYPFWSKKNLKSWMIKAAIGFSWIAGILSMGPLGFLTSVVVEGVCLGYVQYFQIPDIKKGYGTWNFVSFFLIPLIIFVYCYGRILVVMRKQVRVMAGHNVEGSAQSASQAQNKRIKWNIIKTMIIVTAFFIVCFFPLNIYILVVEDPMKTSELAIGYIYTVFLQYINISMNPFIYATKHEGVRRILADIVTCQRQNDITAAVTGTATESGMRGTTGRTGTKHAWTV